MKKHRKNKQRQKKKFTHIPFVKEKEKFLLLLFPPIFLSF